MSCRVLYAIPNSIAALQMFFPSLLDKCDALWAEPELNVMQGPF